MVKGDWETPVTMNDTWGFKKDDHNWKSVPVLIKQLVRIASRGGNYLLNVGQDWGLITSKPAKLYLHVFDWPAKQLTVYGIQTKVRRAYLLADTARKPLAVAQKSDAALDFHSLSIQLPAAAPDPNDSVIVLETGVAPEVVTSLTQQPDNSVTLEAYLAQIHNAAGPGISIDRRGIAINWLNPQDWLSWDFKVFRPGAFDVVALTAAPQRGAGLDGGHQVTVEAAGEQLRATMQADAKQVDPSNPRMQYIVSRLGRIQVAKAGPCQLALRAQAIEGRNKGGLTLASIKLVAVK